jgi:hypothetical protein
LLMWFISLPLKYFFQNVKKIFWKQQFFSQTIKIIFLTKMK